MKHGTNVYKVSSSGIRLQSSIIQIIKKKPTTIARGAPPQIALPGKIA